MAKTVGSLALWPFLSESQKDPQMSATLIVVARRYQSLIAGVVRHLHSNECRCNYNVYIQSSNHGYISYFSPMQW